MTITVRPDWNEIDFIAWDAFRRMAPTVLGLEVARLGPLIDAAPDLDLRNALVRTRFALTTFITRLEATTPDAFEADCGAALRTALLSLPATHPTLDAEATRTLAYVADRLRYIHDRAALIY